MKIILLLAILSFCVNSCSCQKKKIKDNTGIINRQDSTSVFITTDKVRYSPGDEIKFTIDQSLPEGTWVTYKYLNNVVQTHKLTGTSWTWTAPPADFHGYMVEISGTVEDRQKIYGCIAVDVSSDPARFPRNGFLSYYGKMTDDQIHEVMANLNRLHINWVQFQDWEYKHHMPLAGTTTQPAASWKDIANRTNYKSTVQGYIEQAHEYNMKTLSYNLCYGVLEDAATDGVSDTWYMYSDEHHINRDVFKLPSPPFKSWIYFVNPANKGWQEYIAAKNSDMYAVYDFDGYQVDQVGNRDKILYDYSGNEIDLAGSFYSFLNAMKTARPDKNLVMNAVNQYGQQASIAKSPVEFLYTEVWAPNEGYKDLATIIQNNNRWSNYTKNTVLCAYMNYDLAAHPGYFNTPSVLLTDAVIFAFGGAHLELGEHMLGKEYFPNNNLKMPPELQSAMVNYYDFHTAYQNLFRDGGTFNAPTVISKHEGINFSNWPPTTGSVSVIGKDMGEKQVIHFINFANAVTLKWRDADGKQPLPYTYKEITVQIQSDKRAKRIWLASPDVNYGAAQTLYFQQNGNSISLTLPYLKYWDMVVVEY